MSAGRAPVAERLLRRLDEVEARRDALVNELLALPESARSTAPGPGVWSPTEVVEHMVTAERWVLRSLFEPEQRRGRNRSLRQRILYRVVIWILKSPIPVKVPVRGMDPTGEKTLSELVPEWTETHARLRAFLEESSEAELTEACFMHPVSGPLTPTDALTMLATHFDRHAAQIRERIAD